MDEREREIKISRGTLKKGEYHPSADQAMNYLRGLPSAELLMWRESLASCAIENNRAAEICYETLDRLLSEKPVSDRYLLGLAWMIRNNPEKKENKK